MIDLTQKETIQFDFLQEPTQSLETFSTSEPLLINIQDIDISTVQPINIQQPHPIQHPTAFQQMSSQQRAALTNAALINFFGKAGTVSTIMQTVQQTQQTEQYTLDTNSTPTEHCQQLLPVVATDSEEESGMCNSLDITQHQENSLAITQQDNSLDITQQHTTQPEQQISHIQPPTSISTPTSTITNSTLTTTQSDYTRQSYRIPSYYAQSLSYINSRRRRRTHTQTQNKERKHKKKDDN